MVKSTPKPKPGPCEKMLQAMEDNLKGSILAVRKSCTRNQIDCEQPLVKHVFDRMKAVQRNMKTIANQSRKIFKLKSVKKVIKGKTIKMGMVPDMSSDAVYEVTPTGEVQVARIVVEEASSSASTTAGPESAESESSPQGVEGVATDPSLITPGSVDGNMSPGSFYAEDDASTDTTLSLSKFRTIEKEDDKADDPEESHDPSSAASGELAPIAEEQPNAEDVSSVNYGLPEADDDDDFVPMAEADGYYEISH